MAAQSYTIGLDLGGTNIKGGVVGPDGGLVHTASIDTQAERGADHVIARMADFVDELIGAAGIKRADVAAVGLGTPGPICHAKGLIYGAPNLPGWVNIPVRDRLAALVRLPVVVENDANAAAFGEFAGGAGRGVQDMVLFTLGTGVGGGIVLGGRLLRGHFDNAAELGHIIVERDGRPCPCGQRGCVERYASANAVAERYVEALSDLAAAATPNPNSAEIARMAAAGDSLASRIWHEACMYLAMACVDLQHVLNPELIVLGGGMADAGEQLLHAVREQLAARTWKVAPDRPRVSLAELGNHAGIVGAAALARASTA